MVSNYKIIVFMCCKEWLLLSATFESILLQRGGKKDFDVQE